VYYEMLFVAVNGSPHKDGNTVALLREGLLVASKLGHETELIHAAEALQGVKDPFCTECVRVCECQCGQGNSLGHALDILRQADGILIGTPVYFGTVSGQLKAFWDKTRSLRKNKDLLNTVGGVVTVGAARFGGQETALQAVIHMMLVQGMTVVGDGQSDFDCGHFGASAQKPSVEDEFALRRARITMERIIEVAEATKSLRK
jgi:multimeric flavodoxin WrbA